MLKTIWHLCSNRWNSAVTEYALSSARSLKSEGWQTAVSGLSGKAFHSRASQHQLDCYPVKGFGLKDIPHLLSLYRKLKPQVVMVYGGQETFVSKFFRQSAVVRFRGLDQDLSRPPKPLAYRLSQGHLAGLLCPSQQVLKNFESLCPQGIAVPLGIDTEVFQYQAPSEPVHRPTLVVLGRLDPIKGHGAFFLWFSMLLKQWPSTLPKPFLKVVGEPANIPTAHIRGFATDVGLVEGEDWELISHRVQNLPALISKSHLGVVCSQGSEVICRVAEEFLLCGVPLFVSGVGSLEACLYDQDAGVSYRDLPGDQAVQLLKKTLIKAFEETDIQRNQRSQRSQKHFSFRAMGRNLDNYFSQLGPSHWRGLEPSALLTKP